jgi:hypothetical protein
LEVNKKLESKVTSNFKKKDVETKVLAEYGRLSIEDLKNIIKQKEYEVQNLASILSSLDSVEEVSENVIIDIIKKKRINEYELDILSSLVDSLS